MEKWKELLQKAREIAAKAEEAERDLTGEERDQIAKLLEDAKAAKEEAQASKKDAELREKIELFSAAFEEKDEDPAKPGKGGTLGERFVTSEEFKRWMAQVAPSGRIPDRASVNSPPVEFKDLLRFALGRKDLITGADEESAGAFVVPDYTGIYEPLGRHPRTVLDLINRRETTSDTVHFVRQTAQVTQAEPVAEANVTEYSGATGEVEGAKPEGTLEWTPVTTNVKTIAVWIPATKRALSDAAQVRGIIDQELRDDLMEELEDQILNGNGIGENFTGLLNMSPLLTQAWDTDMLTTIRKARTYLRTTGRSVATAMVVHPNDAESLDLLTDDNGQFYFGGPVMGGAQMVWRVPVVESEAKAEGSGLMGDFRKAVLWDREAASIQVSDSHEDFFIRNMVAILAELRAAFAAIRPTAFVEVELETGS